MKEQPEPGHEEMLLIELCRLEISSKQSEKIKSIAGKVTRWDYFARLANDHGISAMVFHNLERTGLTTLLPDKDRAFLKNAYLLSMARNASIMKITGEVIRELNVRIVLLKGAALELMVYGNTGLRQMNDVDLLLTREDCLNGYRHLKRKGFKSLPIKSVLHKSIIGYHGKHLPSLLKSGISVELHHQLFDDEGNDLTGLFYESSVPGDLSDIKVYLPEPMLFFLYLIKHLNSHELNNESQLRLHADLVVLLEKYYDRIIRNELFEYSHIAGMDSVLACKLHLLSEFWHLEFPEYIKNFIRINIDESSTGRFLFFLGSPKNNPPARKQFSYKKNLRQIPGLHRKVLYVAGDLFPTLTFMKERYRCRSAIKAILYYPHRWGKVLWLLKS